MFGVLSIYSVYIISVPTIIIKINKTKEQKVDLFKKNISSKIKDLALTLSYKISDTNYKS
jgi:hypothetical protein